MAANFPVSKDDVSTVGDGTHPSADEALSSTVGGPAHHALHQNTGEAIRAIEDKVGTGASEPAANTVLTSTGSGTSVWGTVATAMIADDAVTAAKVADDAVTKVVVTDTTDATAFPALFESATGNLTPHTDAGLTYNASNATLTATTFVGALTGNASGSSGSCTGNAATATALETARAINGVDFDGTAAITVTAAAGTLTGSTLASGVTSSSLTSVGTLGSLTVTNSVVAADFRATGGTAADPSFMIEDTDTGFFSTGGGTFAATCNSTSVTTWTNTRFRPSSDNAIQLGESGLRWTAVYAVNGTIQTSDMTLKERKGDALGLDFVNDLKPFQGRWKDEDDAACRQFLSAQDVHRSLEAAGINPEDSGMWHDGKHEGLNYSEMVPVLVKAVQELTARLEAVEG